MIKELLLRQLFLQQKDFKMNISTIPKKLKLILSKNKLNKLDKATGFAKISPAAVELHATINLKSGSFEQATITADTFSERAEMPLQIGVS